MVRATRSTTALQHQQTVATEQPHTTSKISGKKRKRVSTATADVDDQPLPKQQRRTEAKLEEENVQLQPGVGDFPLDSEDAVKILDILEMIDTQGLLDRVFPLPGYNTSSSEASTSKDTIKHYSLRSLLQDSTSHPLRVIRAAIHPLFPISSHPRSRPSIPAAQQLHFCNLALSLLDQASTSHPRISLSQSTIFANGDEFESIIPESSERRRRYALVQKLPDGEWWSSSNSIREGENGLTVTEAKDMRKGHAELASIIPTLPLDPSSMSTLGELQMENRKESRHRFRSLHMHPRVLCTGSFLEYGPYSSFAPSFDSEGAEVGRHGLGEYLSARLERRKIKDARKRLLTKLQKEHDEKYWHTESPSEVTVEEKDSVIEDVLTSLFPNQNAAEFKDILHSLQIEERISSLLERNARALERLDILQSIRLRDGFTPVKEDSEEWKLAQMIMESLILLSSLRPRLATDSESDSLLPPPSVLRTLQSTIPIAPSQGWQGTLDETRKTSLRDDTTVHIKGGATHVPTQPAAATTVSTTMPSYTPSPLYAPGVQYRSSSTPYAYQPQPQARQGSQTPAVTQSSYYPNTYQPAAASQYQYYSQWYNYQATAGQKGTAAAAYYGNYTTTPRPVGNTAKPQQTQQNGWTPGHTGSTTATVLPPHLRRTAAATTPGTPTYSPYHPYIPTQPTR
ncbi:hypothetical protein Clacol_003796 [Clathrus columnatus]|uniref:Uncharacterized protein n=1 Tax=Clathrus columnatus TaxID=1419009 RepID=A0AAV5A7X8_9AGAM|nr:hypothetical protein Clacol_003796 [Clathrus columnatus]